jgi:hypothetical protein
VSQRHSKAVLRGLLALALLFAALPILGFGYETIVGAVEARRFPPPGKLVLVDGHWRRRPDGGDGCRVGRLVDRLERRSARDCDIRAGVQL